MHEFSLAKSILDIVVEAAAENSLTRVSSIFLDVGTQSGVSIDSLLFAWEFLRKDEVLTADAELVINVIEAMGGCSNCGYKGKLIERLMICPDCNQGDFQLTTGQQFMVTEISGD